MSGKIRAFLFKNTDAKQTIAKNALWLTVSTVASRIIRAVIVIFAARVLGAEGYGVFSYAMSIAAFLSLFSDLGLTGFLTREIARDPGKKSPLVSTAFVVKAVMLIVMFAVTAFLGKFFITLEAAKPLLLFAALLVVFDSMRIFVFGFARGFNKMETEGIFTFITEVCIAVLAVIMFLPHPSPLSLSASYAVGSGLGAVLAFLAVWKYLKTFVEKPRKDLLKRVLYGSLPFAMAGVFGALMINIDMIILGFFKSARELGLYAAAQRPVQLLYVVPSLLAASVFPILSRFAYTNDERGIKKILENAITGVFVVAFPVTLGGIIIANSLIPLVFGAEYVGAVLSFQLLLSTILFIFPGTIIGNALFSYNMQRKLVYTAAIGAAANVIFDLLLIPPYGISGSAVATIISQVIVNGANWHILHKRIPFVVFPKLFKISTATLFMGGFTFAMNLIGINVVMNIVFSGILFILMLLCFKENFIVQIKNIAKEMR